MIQRQVRSIVRAIVPSAARFWIRTILTPARTDAPTTEAWNQYAQNAKRQGRVQIGEEWNEPDMAGTGVAADQALDYLDRELFTPYIRECEVILEIGPGGGRVTRLLLPKCRRLVACEISPKMMSFLRNRFGDDPRLECVLLDGNGLGPIADQSVDVVVSFAVFVHLQHWDIFSYLREARRVLRPDGRLLVHHANTFSELGWRNFLEEIPYSLNRPKFFGNFSVMTPEIMREFVQRAGLRWEACRTDVVPRDAITIARAPRRVGTEASCQN